MTKKLIISGLTLALVFLVGCQWPFSTKAKVTGYINRVENTFTQTQEQMDTLGTKLNFDDLTVKVMESNLSIAQEIKTQTETDQETITKLNGPEQTKDLNDKAIRYYKVSNDIADLLVSFFSYLDDSVAYYSKLSQYSKDFNNLNTDNLTQAAKQLDAISKKVNKDLKGLKKLETDKETKQVHRQIISTFTSVENLSSDMADAIRAKNVSQLEQSLTEYEEQLTRLESAFSNLKITKSLIEYQKEYNQAEKAVSAEIKSLQKQFNIKT